MLLHSSMNLGRVLTCTNRWWWWWSWRLWHTRNDVPKGSLSSYSQWYWSPPTDFLPPWWPSGLGLRWGFLGKEAPPEPGTGPFWTLQQNTAFSLALAPHGGWGLGQSKEGLVCACARDQLMCPQTQASLERMEPLILQTIMLPGSRIKEAKIWAILTAHLETAMSRMSWILESSSCHSKAVITAPSEPCKQGSSTNQSSPGKRNMLLGCLKWHQQWHQCQSEGLWSIFIWQGSEWYYQAAKKPRMQMQLDHWKNESTEKLTIW